MTNDLHSPTPLVPQWTAGKTNNLTRPESGRILPHTRGQHTTYVRKEEKVRDIRRVTFYRVCGRSILAELAADFKGPAAFARRLILRPDHTD